MRFEVFFAQPGLATLPAFPFGLCLGEIHRYSCAAEGSGGVGVHRGEATSSRGGCSQCLCLGHGSISGSGRKEPVRTSALSRGDVLQCVVGADESLFPLAQVVNFKKSGLSSFDKFYDFVEHSIPYDVDQGGGMGMFIVLGGDKKLAQTSEVVFYALPLLLSESEEFLLCIPFQGGRLEGGNEVFLEFFYRHVDISGFCK